MGCVPEILVFTLFKNTTHFVKEKFHLVTCPTNTLKTFCWCFRILFVVCNFSWRNEEVSLHVSPLNLDLLMKVNIQEETQDCDLHSLLFHMLFL